MTGYPRIGAGPLHIAHLLWGGLFMLAALVVLATAPPDATLKAAHALRVPGLIIQLALLTYRYLFLLADELGRLRTALRVRGYRNRMNRHSYRTVGHVAGTLLVRRVSARSPSVALSRGSGRLTSSPMTVAPAASRLRIASA